MSQSGNSSPFSTGLSSTSFPLEQFQQSCEDADLDSMTRMFATYRGVDVRVSTQSGGSNGKDFTRFMPVSNGNFITAVGNVRGQPQALAGLKAFLEFKCDSLFRELHSLEGVFSAFNDVFVETSGVVVSLFAALAEVETGFLHYISAGYNLPLAVRGPGKVEALNAGSYEALGAVPSPNYARARCAMPSGSTLVIHSGGFVDAANEVGEKFGMDRLSQLVSDSYDTVDDLNRALWKAARTFRGTSTLAEDATLVLLKF